MFLLKKFVLIINMLHAFINSYKESLCSDIIKNPAIFNKTNENLSKILNKKIFINSTINGIQNNFYYKIAHNLNLHTHIPNENPKKPYILPNYNIIWKIGKRFRNVLFRTIRYETTYNRVNAIYKTLGKNLNKHSCPLKVYNVVIYYYLTAFHIIKSIYLSSLTNFFNKITNDLSVIYFIIMYFDSIKKYSMGD